MLQTAGRGDPSHDAAALVETVILVPGFFSPAWMMRPLRRLLLRRHVRAEIWDDAAFSESADANAKRLASELTARREPVRLVAHSYGALLVALALSRTATDGVRQLILTAPTVSPVRGVRWVPHVVQQLVPALGTLTRPRETADLLAQLSQSLPILLLWSRYDAFVNSRVLADCSSIRQIHVRATHNSLLFQPSVLRRIADELEQPA